MQFTKKNLTPKHRSLFGALALCTCILLGGAYPPETAIDPPLYQDTQASIDQRVQDLLGRMTVEEKVAQALCYVATDFMDEARTRLEPTKIDRMLKSGIGQIRDMSWISVDSSVRFHNYIQRKLVEETRLGIPAIVHGEGLHGYVSNGATSFPQPIALASSWDRALIQEVYSVIAAESRSRGVQQLLTPVLDIARDARWGRTTETYGEDPFLTAELITYAIRGMQGEGDAYLDQDHVIATLKHFPAHGNPLGGLNCSAAQVSDRLLRNVHMYPFSKAIQDAKAASIMAMYGTLNGEAVHASEHILKHILREEIGFDGLVVSDYRGIDLLGPDPVWDLIGHHVAEDSIEAALLAAKAGVNIELVSPYAYPALESLVAEGRFSEAELDELIRPLLRLKFELGLFENPYVEEAKALEITGRAASDSLTYTSAVESLIMLKNEANVLPLKRETIKTLAVVGPNSNRQLLGDYSTKAPKYFSTVLEGVKAKAGASMKVIYEEGCKITPNTPEHAEQLAQDRQSIQQTVSAVKDADAILVVVGGDKTTAKEGLDRNELDLAGLQEELVLALTQTGKPVILCLIGGLPYAIPEVYDAVDALYIGWYLGQETGNAIAASLFGEANPSGKLPISIPRSIGHLPVFYNKMPVAYQRKYTTDAKGGGALYPFGYGLSYSEFSYAELQVATDTVALGEEIRVKVKVKNVGDYAGTEVVQLYIHDRISRTTRPMKELKDFARVDLAPGEEKTCEFVFPTDRLAFYNIENKFTVEPGAFEIMVGASSEDRDLLRTRVWVKE